MAYGVSPFGFILFLVLLLLGGELFWILSDPRSLEEKRKRKISLTYPRVTLVLIPQILSGLFFPWNVSAANAPLVGVGLFLFFSGFVLAVWARCVMGAFWAPPGEWNSKRQGRLITSGPFALTRNPIYLGVASIALGFSLAVQSYFLPLVILLFLSLRQSAVEEETLLRNRFGKTFEAYAAKVPRFLF